MSAHHAASPGSRSVSGRDPAKSRDSARRRVRTVSFGITGAAVVATSLGALALAQPAGPGAATVANSSITASQNNGSATTVTSGSNQQPVANSGGS